MHGTYSLKPLSAFDPLDDLDDQNKAGEDRYKRWAQTVGDTRAREAEEIARNGRKGFTGQKSTTLPELLIEAALRKRGIDYQVQVDLGWARPDFVVPVPGGCVVVECQGDYWHGSPEAKVNDAKRAAQLIGVNVNGATVLRVIEIWESEIYLSEAPIERVFNG
jgi:G:T-mismatch repair DNA endonuclease (very short patch repair protein)